MRKSWHENILRLIISLNQKKKKESYSFQEWKYPKERRNEYIKKLRNKRNLFCTNTTHGWHLTAQQSTQKTYSLTYRHLYYFFLFLCVILLLPHYTRVVSTQNNNRTEAKGKKYEI